MIPFLLIYIFNWLMFILIFVSLLRKKALTRDSSGSSSTTARKLKQNFIVALTLSLLFGLGWGIGLAATTSIPVPAISYVLQTFFVFLTTFQGLLIFIMHCVRSAEARNQWKHGLRILSVNKITLDLKKSMASGPTSSDYTKGTHGKFDYSTLSSAAQGTHTLQRILKKEAKGSRSDMIIQNEHSICDSSMVESTEVDKVDLSLTSATDVAASSEASYSSTIKQQDGAQTGEGEMGMKERILKSYETGTGVIPLPGERESIISKFDTLWLRGEGSENTSRSSLSAAGKRLSRQSAVAQLSTGDIALPADVRATNESCAVPSNDKAPLIEGTEESDTDARTGVPTSGETDDVKFE